MQAELVIELDVDTENLPAYLRDKIRLKFFESVHPHNGKVKKSVPYLPAGTTVTHDVVGYIARGQAIPADDEAKAACGFSPEEIAIRTHKYRRQAAGIWPEDYHLFDAGMISGYNLDGTYRPGPNWAAYQASEKTAPATEASAPI